MFQPDLLWPKIYYYKIFCYLLKDFSFYFIAVTIFNERVDVLAGIVKPLTPGFR